MRIFGSDRMDGMLQKLGLKEDEAIVHPWINKALEKAQQKVEARNFDIRKNLLKYDNVMNDQRKVIFEQRIELMARRRVARDGRRHAPRGGRRARRQAHSRRTPMPSSGTSTGSTEAVRRLLNLDLPVEDWAKEEGIADEEIRERLRKAADEAYAQARRGELRPELMREVEKQVLLQTLDHLWREHLVTLDHLRQVIGFRGYAQRDPLNEYKTEAFELFNAARRASARAVTGQLMRIEVVFQPPAPEGLPPMLAQHLDPVTGEDEMPSTAQARSAAPVPPAATRPRRSAANRRRARPARSLDLGQGRPQRGLPVRLRQEVQALPRAVRAERS